VLKLTATPSVTVGAGIYINGDVLFTLGVQATPKAPYKYQYSTNGTDWYNLDGTTGDGASTWGTSVTPPVNTFTVTTGYEIYRFRAITQAKVADELSFIVNIEKLTPQMSIIGYEIDGEYTESDAVPPAGSWTNKNVTVYVLVTGLPAYDITALPDNIDNIIRSYMYVVTGLPSFDLVKAHADWDYGAGIYVYSFEFAANGSLGLQAIGRNGVQGQVWDFDADEPVLDGDSNPITTLTVALANVIDTIEPVLSIAAPNADKWSTGVTFTFRVTNVRSVLSGLARYEYDVWDEDAGEWFDDWQPVDLVDSDGTLPATGLSDIWTLSKVLDNGVYRFRIVTVAGNYGYFWDNNDEDIPFEVRIDRGTPILYNSDITDQNYIETYKPVYSPTDPTDGNVTVTVYATYTASNRDLSNWLVRTGGAWPGDGEVPVGRLVDSVDGVYYTYEYVFTFTANGTLTVRAMGRNGEQSADLTLTVSNIERIAPNLRVDAPNANKWSSGVTFTFTFDANGGAAGIEAYQYQARESIETDPGIFELQWGAWFDGVDTYYGVYAAGRTWAENEWVTLPGAVTAANAWTVAGAAMNGEYRFRVVTMAGNASNPVMNIVDTVSLPFEIRIDEGTPTLHGETDPVYAVEYSTKDLINKPITVTVYATYTISGIIGENNGDSWLVLTGGVLPHTMPAGSRIGGTNTYKYVFTFENNGSFTIRAASANGKGSGALTITVGNIEYNPPNLRVDATNMGLANNWYPSVTFTLTPVMTNVASGVAQYQYYKGESAPTVDNEDDWVSLGVNAGAAIDTITFNTAAGTGYYWFRVISGAGNMSDANGSYRVRIDTETPAIELLGIVINGMIYPDAAATAGAYTNEPIEVYVKATYTTSEKGDPAITSSNGTITSVTPVSSFEGTATAGSVQVYKLTFSYNPTDIEIRARGGNTLETPSASAVKFSLTAYDTSRPALSVNAPNANKWSASVTFAFTFDAQGGTAGVAKYQYQKRNADSTWPTVWTDLSASVTANNAWTVSSAAMNGEYRFQVVTTAGNTNAQTVLTGPFEIRIDEGSPELVSVTPSIPMTTVTNQTVSVTVRVTYSESDYDPSNPYVVVPASAVHNAITANGPTLVSGKTYDFTFIFERTLDQTPINGSFTIRARGWNGNESADIPVEVTNVELTEPRLNVSTSRPNEWGTEVTFEFNVLNMVSISGGLLKYQYNLWDQALNGGKGDWSDAWVDIELDVNPMTGNNNPIGQDKWTVRYDDLPQAYGIRGIDVGTVVLANGSVVRFRVISNANNEGDFGGNVKEDPDNPGFFIPDPDDTFQVMIDGGTPGIEEVKYFVLRNGNFEELKDPAKQVSQDVYAWVYITYTISDYDRANSLVYSGNIPLDGRPAPEDITGEYTSTVKDGVYTYIYRFRFSDVGSYLIAPKGANGNTPTDGDGNIQYFAVSVGNINYTQLGIRAKDKTVELNNESISARIFTRAVTLTIENPDLLDATGTRIVNNKNGKEISFVDYNAAVSKNGSYTIYTKTIAGVEVTYYLTISKPAYWAIIGGPILALLIIAVIVWFVVQDRRRRIAMNRLIANSTSNDDAAKFLLYKKIK